MRKILLSSVVAASLAVSSFAEEGSSSSSFYMGIGYNSMSGTQTTPYTLNYGSYWESLGAVDHNDEDKIDDMDADGSTIKIGWDKKSYRFEISYSSIKAKGTGSLYNGFTAYNNGTTTVYKTTKSLDEKFTGFDFDFIKPFTDNSLKPYIAAGLGYYSWDNYTVKSTTSSETRDRIALAYNLGAGLLYSLGSVELDVAYKWKKLNWEDVIYDNTNYDIDVKDEETTITGLYVGINYHF